MNTGPSLDAIRDLRESLADKIDLTPVVRCAGLEDLLANGTQVFGKLEFLQRTGTFKARSALATVSGLTDQQRAAGLTAVSAGNHAIATAYAAKAFGASAKVVMMKSANSFRVEECRKLGAEVVLADDVHRAFELAETIQDKEGRFLVHPFEGEAVATGTGMVGLEICEQIDDFDILLVSVGGGGLIGGISNAVKQLRPDCGIVGVEPEGANSMQLSLAAGEPVSIPQVTTIADSLGAPFAMPYSFSLCQQNVDRLVSIDDEQMRCAMGLLFSRMKFAVESGCAATTAALLGPLRDELAGKRVVLVFCGSNIDWATFASQVRQEPFDAD